MTSLTPFLLFDGNCAEAMAFYQRCLGGELTIVRLGDTPMAAQHAQAKHGRVVHARLIAGPIILTATDWLHETRRPRPGNTVGLYLNDAPFEELRRSFDALSEGADPDLLDELRDLPFGSYGHLCDRFGVHWFFQGEPRPV